MATEVMRVAEDLRLAAKTVADALGPAAETADWSTTAAPTDWSCRDTLDHIANALCGYATSLANRLNHRRRHHPRDGDTAATAVDLLETVSSFAGVLAAVAESTGPDVRAFHPAGMADRDGFVAMGCDELLVHTGDIAAALGRVRPTERARCADRQAPLSLGADGVRPVGHLLVVKRAGAPGPAGTPLPGLVVAQRAARSVAGGAAPANRTRPTWLAMKLQTWVSQIALSRGE